MSSYTHSKEQLNKLKVPELIVLLHEINRTNKTNQSGISRMRKPQLIEMIWEKWGGDEGWTKHKKSESKSAKPFDIQSKNDDSPSDEYDSDTPKQKPPPPPKEKIVTKPIRVDDSDSPSDSDTQQKPPPPKKKTVVTKSIPLETVEFKYNEEKDIMNIKIELTKYTPGAPEPPDADDISPEELIELINKDEFCIKTANSLKDIYKAKLEKYQKLQKKTLQSITNDTAEKNEMLLTSGIEKQELDRLFPMITINTAFLIKLKALSRLAITKGIEYDGTNTRRVIEMVRKNLLEAITDKEDGIVSVTGMSREKIRNQLCKTLYILSKGYRPFMDAFLNLVFTGPAGVGKTKLAKTYSFVFKKAGILLQGDLIIASPKDMVGEYIGHTAIKSAGVLMKGLEGVILIDEAYQMPCNNGVLEKDSKSFGPEAITEIVNFLDKYMGMSIMIVAGYEREMENCFFAANEGLNRRFPNRISIPSYSNSDLLSIFINGVNTKIGEDIFNEETIRYIFTLIVKLSQADTKIFSNQAGDMVNLSSMFINSYYGSVKINWRENYASDIRIVNSTFNQFLRNKGYLAAFTHL